MIEKISDGLAEIAALTDKSEFGGLHLGFTLRSRFIVVTFN